MSGCQWDAFPTREDRKRVCKELETGDLPAEVHVEVSLVLVREDGLQTLHELVHYGQLAM